MNEQLQAGLSVLFPFTLLDWRDETNEGAIGPVHNNSIVEQVPLGPILIGKSPAAFHIPVIYKLLGAVSLNDGAVYGISAVVRSFELCNRPASARQAHQRRVG